MFLSVIVPTCHRYPALSQCLAALSSKAQGLNPDAYEVIVTDDSSNDTSKLGMASEFPWARWTEGPKRGPAANRNCGARKAKGDWLVFIDDDCIPNAKLLTSYLEAIAQNPHFLVFEGAILAERPKCRMDEEAPINVNGGYLWSCNFMIQRAPFFSLGGFCELFPYAAMEDVDLRERLKQAGHSYLFVPEASVIHPWRTYQPEGKYLKIKFLSHVLFYTRYPELRESWGQSLYYLAGSWFRELRHHGLQVRYRGIAKWSLRAVTNLFLFTWLALKTRHVKKAGELSSTRS